MTIGTATFCYSQNIACCWLRIVIRAVVPLIKVTKVDAGFKM